ncbi:MAG: UDP-N-acetylglucosamine--N-acetylmuramyl-(pentapeptide) pyrophosphoryl-undecaprenol N-acetylglucosamine transferase [Spirochaetales bacterium]|nr:UDP-N-acetylglucosamine--N-acetylmuramyl-(pentapeptide) pyrophosphoryl-undecaprenol N-acetylglucosamine transferase [Spirochaetales bacterium]
MSTIAFTGGGTGGHVYPAKPLIDLIKKETPQKNIYWIGSAGGMEEDILKDWNIPYRGISSGKLRRYFDLKNFTDLFRIIAGFFQARRTLRKERPEFLFSKGGFVSVPPVLAAKTLGIPVYTHESDVTPGLATRINSRFVNKIFLPYEASLKYNSPKFRDKCVVSGNPVRDSFFAGEATKGRAFVGAPESMPILLVMGGSLGAEQLNKLVEENLEELTSFCFVIHQTGSKNFVPLERDNYYRAPYFKEELSHILTAATASLSRAGAAAIWELAASRTPMLLLPLISGSRGDQVYNARVFEEAGAARILDEKTDLDGDSFISAVKAVLQENNTDWAAVHSTLKMGQAQKIILKTIEEDRA